MKQHPRLVAALRWIAVLPAAVGAALGVQLLVILATTILSDWQVQLINSVAVGYAFVAVGAAMAPRHHYMASLVLAGLLGFYAVFVIATYKFTAWMIVCGMASLGAAVLAVVTLHEKRKFASSPKNDCGN